MKSKVGQAVPDCRLVHVLQDHRTSLERLGWKNMDPEEFGLAFINLMKELGKVATQVTKVSLRIALRASRLALTAAEGDLLSSKIRSTQTWVRKKLRDAGSGKFLPRQVVAIAKVWRGPGKERKNKKEKKKKKDSEDESVPAMPSPKKIRSLFGLPEKKVTEVEVLDSDSEEAHENGAGPTSSSAMPPGSWG